MAKARRYSALVSAMIAMASGDSQALGDPPPLDAPAPHLLMKAMVVGLGSTQQRIELDRELGNNCLLPLPPCAGDVWPTGGNGVTDIDDLIQGVVNHWAQSGPPRPIGDCTPLPLGDCTVNVDDLIQVLNDWGECPTEGACCIKGACSFVTAADCSWAGGLFLGVGVQCRMNPCPQPPANDLCANASIAVNGVNNWNNAGANTDGPAVPTRCSSAPGGTRDVWFNYQAPCSGPATFDTFGTMPPFTDTVLQVFDGSGCNPLGALLGCNDNASSANLLSRIELDLTAGQIVKVRCMSWSTAGSNQGAARLNIVCESVKQPCFNGPQVTIGTPISGSIIGATQDAAPLCNNVAAGIGRWFRVIGNGHNLRACTCDSPLESWDGRLSVYCGEAGSCPELACIAASATFDCGPAGPGSGGCGNPISQTGLHESVTWCSVSGQWYYILVHTDSLPLPPEGNFTLIVDDLATPCTASPCALMIGD